jgi:hypothetical protein
VKRDRLHEDLVRGIMHVNRIIEEGRTRRVHVHYATDIDSQIKHEKMRRDGQCIICGMIEENKLTGNPWDRGAY